MKPRNLRDGSGWVVTVLLGPTATLRRVAPIVFALLLLGACDPPTVTDETISLGPLVLDPAMIPGESIDRELWIVGDAATTAMRLNLEIFDFPLAPPSATNAFLMIRSGSGTEVQRITTNGPVTSSEIPGNVARVTLVAAAGAATPDVNINSVTLTRSNQPAVPADAPVLADQVSAVPLIVGQTVDFAFPDAERHHFFAFRAPHDGWYDLAYFGPGRLLIQAANDPNYPLHAATVQYSIPAAGSSVPFARILMGANEVRRMGVDNGPAPAAAGRGRIVVMDIGPIQKLAFPSQAPQHFWLTAMGVDHGPAALPGGTAGTRGGMNGVFDCQDYEGKMGIALGPSPDGFVPVFGVPPCYKGHEGTDWAVHLGPGVQIAQVHFNAAASGVVLAVDEANFDECTADPFSNWQVRCPDGILSTAAPIDNYIAIRQDDGLIAYYVHGGTGAAQVVPGQRVACGEKLSVVASAGNSLGPHLHFELQDVSGADFWPGPKFTNMFLVKPQGSTAVPIREEARWVDPFDPPTRWRRLGPNQGPTPDCR